MEAMEVMHRCCCGMDVHKDSVVACVRRIDAAGRASDQVRTFGTTTAALLSLGDWLVGEQVPIAAMESTGGVLEADLESSGGPAEAAVGQCP